MLRLTELKLPLDHPPEAIEAAIRARLGLRGDELRAFHVARRAWDARKRLDIFLVYSVDLEVADEAALLRSAGRDRTLARTLGPTPDTDYRQVAHAPAARPGRSPLVTLLRELEKRESVSYARIEKDDDLVVWRRAS